MTLRPRSEPYCAFVAVGSSLAVIELPPPPAAPKPDNLNALTVQDVPSPAVAPDPLERVQLGPSRMEDLLPRDDLPALGGASK
jgi:hypothetical protein